MNQKAYFIVLLSLFIVRIQLRLVLWPKGLFFVGMNGRRLNAFYVNIGISS